MTTQFKVGDIVTIEHESIQYPNKGLNHLVGAGHVYEITEITDWRQDGTLIMYIIYPPTGYWMAEDWFELVPTIVAQGMAIMDQAYGDRWGDAEPVTSNAPRKIPQAERDLIEQRIATRRKLRGDFS